MNTFAALFGERYSLRRNLVFNITFALCFCIAAACIILIREFYEHLDENLEAALSLEAKEVIGQIDPDATNYGLNPDAIRFRGVEGIYRYTVFESSGKPVAGNETSPEIAQQMLALDLGATEKIRLLGDRIGVGLKAKINDTDFYVLVSTYPANLEETRLQKLYHEVEEEIGWVFLGIFLILTAALLATRQSLKSLHEISQQAQDIGPTDPDRRLSTDKLPSEIAPLIDAVNGAFARLEQGYRSQRDFSSNVAHEIRTPLAVLRSSVERIENSKLRADIKQDVSRLDRMFEQLIDLSRADALAQTAYSKVDLRKLAVDLASDMASETIRSGRTLAVTGASQSFVVGNPGLLTIALGNLVRNALHYSPEGTEVEIEVLERPAGLRVLDRGPGVPEKLKTDLFERFNRGSSSGCKPVGSGLGLAIVKSVADAHDAQVRIEDRQGGGSVFVFDFSQHAQSKPNLLL